MLPTKFQVNWPFDSGDSEKKRKLDFQDGRHGGHLGFPIGTILAIFTGSYLITHDQLLCKEISDVNIWT